MLRPIVSSLSASSSLGYALRTTPALSSRHFSTSPALGQVFQVTPENKEILEQTIPAVADTGVKFTKYFYNRMFTAVPCLKNIFNSTNQAVGKQPAKLFATVAEAAVSCVEGRDFDEAMAESICHKHCALAIQRNQYGVVGEHLLGTISECLTDDKKVLGAWGELYGGLAEKLAKMEEDLYQEVEQKEGGWRGKRDFKLVGRELVADDIARLRFEPADGGKVCGFKNGQYTTVWSQPEGWEHCQPRHYTLSAPSDEAGYVVTVRKQGLMSNHLHSVELGSKFQMSAPFGSFDMRNLEELWLRDPTVPVVFLSAGVGITPILSMLEAVQENPNGPVVWLHASKRGANHPYRARLQDIASSNDWLKRRVWYEFPEEEDKNNQEGTPENLKKFHFEGRMELDQVSDLVPFGDTRVQYYLCGPPGFMEGVIAELGEKGVGKERVHFESF